jgi:FXSXX-COOH protein
MADVAAGVVNSSALIDLSSVDLDELARLDKSVLYESVQRILHESDDADGAAAGFTSSL